MFRVRDQSPPRIKLIGIKTMQLYDDWIGTEMVRKLGVRTGKCQT